MCDYCEICQRMSDRHAGQDHSYISHLAYSDGLAYVMSKAN